MHSVTVAVDNGTEKEKIKKRTIPATTPAPYSKSFQENQQSSRQDLRPALTLILQILLSSVPWPSVSMRPTPSLISAATPIRKIPLLEFLIIRTIWTSKLPCKVYDRYEYKPRFSNQNITLKTWWAELINPKMEQDNQWSFWRTISWAVFWGQWTDPRVST